MSLPDPDWLNGNNQLLRVVYVIMAALAGAVTALAFMKWKEMSTAEIALTLFVGASFAIFVTPWIAASVFGVRSSDAAVIAGLTYVTASGSNTLLPILIKRIERLFGNGESK